MLKTSLNGKWILNIPDENIFNIKGDISANVPGSVFTTLLEQGLIPDPFYRDNELDVLKLSDNDFEYRKTFPVTKEMLDGDAVILRFDGLDTIAEIYLNDEHLMTTMNMHRTYEFDVSEILFEGENELDIVFRSPVKYIRKKQEKCFVGGTGDAMAGFSHLRKAHCMFGWDWGPRIPDAGIFRDVTILTVKKARIDNVYIRQLHKRGRVIIEPEVMLAGAGTYDGYDSLYDEVDYEVRVTSPDGRDYFESGDGSICIDDPQLWWPNGYGKQPLYTITVDLLDAEDGTVLDTWERKIGLRTLTIARENDKYGISFAHKVNGLKIFARGANYIPEDSLLGRRSREKTEKLLKSAVFANHCVVRVWGGGYYPDDWFYDLCDELGLIVWQDFMFACASYELDDEFEENITAEVVENMRRIRHHACLGLWCGNNELEDQIHWNVWKNSEKQRYDYVKIFEYIIPKLVKDEDPEGFYWPSSPSCGGNFDNGGYNDRGDQHYWEVWHGSKPFTDYRNYFFRYLSEFGFQSFPSMKTIESFTEEKDRNIFSRVMEMHQRNAGANGKIMTYLSSYLKYPKDLDSLIYASQLMQEAAIRYGVEHFRRYRGRCMGTIIWQLNDIWPVASWSGIDWYGRYKALQYGERRMFEPVHISCEETGALSERPSIVAEPFPIEKSAKLHVANETAEEVSGTVSWALRDPKSKILLEGKEHISVPAYSGTWLEKLDFSNYNEFNVCLTYEFIPDGKKKACTSGSVLFVPPKHFEFSDPTLSVSVKGDTLTVTSKAYAMGVWIEGTDGDVILSDNCFDMTAGKKTVKILEGNATEFTVRSVFDIN